MHRLFAFLFVALTATPWARAQFEVAGGNPATSVTWACEAKTIAANQPFRVALQLSHPAGWHSYYRNSNGVERPPHIDWTLPEGFQAGPIQWPVPEVKDGFVGKSFVYPDSPVLLVELIPPAGIVTGTTVTLTAKASWQICAEMCLDETASMTFKLAVGPTMEADPASAELLAKAVASQPAAATGWQISAQSAGGDIQLRVKPPGALQDDPTDFVPDQPFARAASDGGAIRRDGDAWLIQLKRAQTDALSHEPIPQGGSFSGILLGPRPVLVSDTPIVKPPATTMHSSGLLSVLGGMLLGGLLLNLMPCVFPVLGLKIMGFVHQAGESRRRIALHGLIFTLGVLLSFGVLSTILYAMRQVFGWGFQLQDPRVVFGLLLVMFVLALNLFGLFEIGTSATSVGGSLQTKSGLAGSFFSGALATVVATPCSGPFLGPAIGVAIGLPGPQFFLAFMTMAIGLALPYLILSLFPRLLAFLPRPGAWMESFKQAMSFLLFATAGYLLWIYAGQIGLDHLLNPILGLSAIAVAAWIHGRWNLPHRSTRARRTATLAALAFAVTGFFLAKPPPPANLIWETWSPERSAELLAADTPVYIDFTAQWCATCQFNKMRAYTPEVIALMKAKGVVALKADKTQPNPQIEAALQQFGRTAIPVNVLLAPHREPVIFPPLLSPRDLLDALQQL